MPPLLLLLPLHWYTPRQQVKSELNPAPIRKASGTKQVIIKTFVHLEPHTRTQHPSGLDNRFFSTGYVICSTKLICSV
jgi:hypothetical protein